MISNTSGQLKLRAIVDNRDDGNDQKKLKRAIYPKVMEAPGSHSNKWLLERVLLAMW